MHLSKLYMHLHIRSIRGLMKNVMEVDLKMNRSCIWFYVFLTQVTRPWFKFWTSLIPLNRIRHRTLCVSIMNTHPAFGLLTCWLTRRQNCVFFPRRPDADSPRGCEDKRVVKRFVLQALSVQHTESVMEFRVKTRFLPAVWRCEKKEAAIE